MQTLEPGLLTIDESAEFLRVSRSTVYRLIRGGELEVVKVGRVPRVTMRSLRDYIDRAARTV